MPADETKKVLAVVEDLFFTVKIKESANLDFSSTKPTYTWWHLDGKLETVCSIGHHLRIEKIVQNADDVVGDVRRLAGAGRWRTKWTHAARWRRLGIMEGIGMGRRS